MYDAAFSPDGRYLVVSCGPHKGIYADRVIGGLFIFDLSIAYELDDIEQQPTVVGFDDNVCVSPSLVHF